MSLVPIKSLDEYKRVKESLRNTFESERTGDQDLFRQQTKLLNPLITSNEDSAKTTNMNLKAIKDSQTETTRDIEQAIQTAIPMIRAGINNALEDRQRQPDDSFGTATDDSKEDSILKVDLDGQLNVTDKENLELMKLELPSLVLKNQIIGETLNQIKTENKRIGQLLGVKSKANRKEQEIYESQKVTLTIYKEIIKGLEGAKQFLKSSTPKQGKGRKGTSVDTIYYATVDDLCEKLADLDAAKRAGHTGINNHINSILDELLKIKAIDKVQYDTLYKGIFK